MNTKKIILAAVAIWLVGIAYAYLTCGWLFNWVYTLPPLIWLSPSEMMTTGNLIGSNLVGLASAFFFALVYALLYKGLPKAGVKKGLVYGFFVWLVGAATGLLSLMFYMTISSTVVVYWVISGLVRSLILGAIVGGIYKEK